MAQQLTAQQRTAVENRGGMLLVSAAAGSGKTKVLVDRLMSYLTDPNDPANLDDFLIITYTKAAAAELRGKIAAKLTERIAENPENRHLQQHMQRLYLAKISTVHAFCGDLLREYAYRLDLSADFHIADETQCEELIVPVMEQLLDRAYATAGEDPDFCAFIDTQGLGRDDRLIPQILLQVYNAARCHLDPEGWLDWCAGSADAQLTDAAETVWGAYLVEDLRQYLRMQIDAMTNCARAAAAADGFEKPAALLEETLLQLRALLACRTWDEIVQAKQIDYGRLLFPKQCPDEELRERIKAIREACKEGLEKKLRAFADPSAQVLSDLSSSAAATRGLIKLVRQFDKDYTSRKRTRRVLDFSDLEHRTLDLLLGKKRTGPTALAREISVRFREIMVDEYQDSNAVQDAIFRALTQQRQNCFMVGDVKQSIYQFRLADPGVFIEKYNAYADAQCARPGEGRKVLLSSNFRSSGGVISAVNDVFTACMSEQVGGLEYGPEEMLYEGLTHVPLDEPEVELCAVQVQEDTYAEEAAFTAQRIEQLLDGKHMVRQGDALRPIMPEDIVILLRSPGSVGGEFVYALQQRGIRCTTGGSVDLLQTQEVSTLRSLLQVISNPLQDIALIAVLASPVFGFSADELSQIRSSDYKASMYSALMATGSEKAEQFLELLTLLRREARLYPLPQLLQRIFLHTGFDSICNAMENGRERLSNLQLFCMLAAERESGGQGSLEQFLEYLDAMQERGLAAAGPQVSGAVTVMSIHKSKGLEFPVVFLCGLSRSFNRESTRAQVLCDKDLGLGLSCVDTRQRVRYPTLAKRAIATKIMADSISEEMRVLYVAMTRARDRLIMTYASRYLEGQLRELACRLDMSRRQLLTSEATCPGTWVLLTALQRTEAGALFALGGRPDCVCVRQTAWDIRFAEAPETVQTELAPEEQEQELPEALLERLGRSLAFVYPQEAATRTPSKQTATQLKGRSKDQEAAEDTVQYTKRHFRQPDFARQTARGSDYGNAMHALLQHVRYEACCDEQGVRQELCRLAEAGLLTQQQKDMIDCGQLVRFFTSPMGQKLCSGVEVLREFKFSILDDARNYQADIEGEQVLLQGVVDCALLEPDGITVLDFKTDRLTDETLPDAVQRYTPQVRSYAQALRRIYKQPVKAAYLYFFRLDRLVPISC